MLPNETHVFHCNEESAFYRYCIEQLIFSKEPLPKCILELGSGDGGPVLLALETLPSSKRPLIHGYEINELSHRKFTDNIQKFGMEKYYIAHHETFFDIPLPSCDTLISNPPYLPHKTGRFSYPFLWGGIYGNQISKQILDIGKSRVMLIVSSYSDPIGLIDYATKLDYQIIEFIITDIEFGSYSKEPEVFAQIQTLREEGKAFFHGKKDYQIAGVLFGKETHLPDKNHQFLKKMTTP